MEPTNNNLKLQDVEVFKGVAVECFFNDEVFFILQDHYDSSLHGKPYNVLHGWIAWNGQAQNGQHVVGVFDSEYLAKSELHDLYGHVDASYTQSIYGGLRIIKDTLLVFESFNGYALYGKEHETNKYVFLGSMGDGIEWLSEAMSNEQSPYNPNDDHDLPAAYGFALVTA